MLSVYLDPLTTVLNEFYIVSPQVWCAMTLITKIRNRLCSFRLLHVTGDVKKCVELSRKCDEAVLASRTLKKQHVAMAEEAGKRLEQIDL